MKKILMCPPDHYSIEYEINPWMDVNNEVDKLKVKNEYQELKNTYQSLGVEVWEITPEPGLPDMVYAANYGYAEEGLFVRANFKFPQRQRESELADEFFNRKGFRIEYLPEDINFEGQGDLLKVHDKFLMGWGKRTSSTAAEKLQTILNREVLGLELITEHYYHLDTCLAVISEKIVVINETAFTETGLEQIYEVFDYVIIAGDEDNKRLACNLVVIDKNVILGHGVSDKFKQDLANFGYTTIEVEMNEYLKGGGSVKCLSLEIFD